MGFDAAALVGGLEAWRELGETAARSPVVSANPVDHPV
jgi:hypothetical protein